MTDFEAVPERLSRAGDRLHDLVEVFNGQAALRFSARASEAGDSVLAEALKAFQQASTESAAVLTEDARRLGDRMHEAARRYRMFEGEAAGIVSALDVAEHGGDISSVIVEDSVIRAVLG